MITSVWLWVVAIPVIAGLIVHGRRKRGWTRPRSIFVGVFSFYLIVVAAVTLFPIPVEHVLRPQFGAVPYSDWFELRPFTISFQPSIMRIQTLPNVALGIPFGFGAWFVLNNPSMGKVVALGVAGAAGIEIVQHLISLVFVGFPYRVSDISDLIFNSIGVVIGVVIYSLFAWIWRAMDTGTSNNGLIGHIRTTVSWR